MVPVGGAHAKRSLPVYGAPPDPSNILAGPESRGIDATPSAQVAIDRRFKLHSGRIKD
jgi:hypothetical protein